MKKIIFIVILSLGILFIFYKIDIDSKFVPNPDRIIILDNFMISNGNNPVVEIKAVMLTKLSTKGPDILAIGGGEGSSIRDVSRHRTFGLGDFGEPDIVDTKKVRSFLLDQPVATKKISKKN